MTGGGDGDALLGKAQVYLTQTRSRPLGLQRLRRGDQGEKTAAAPCKLPVPPSD
jgi:hypothetical protein